MGSAAAPFLVRRLKRADSWERWYATHRLNWPSWVKRIVPAETDWNGRRGDAALLLAQLGPSATNVVGELIPFYSKLRERKTTTGTIPRGPAVSGQRFFIYYSDELVRVKILGLLGVAGRNNPEVLNILVAALQESEMAPVAIQALVKLAEQNEKVIPRLIEELGGTNSLARKCSAESLGLTGSKAGAAIARLKERVEERTEADRQVRYMSADALWKIDHQAYAIVPFRIEELKNPVESVRWSAAGFLGAYGDQSKPAVPALLEILKAEKNNRVRGKAAIALGQIGPAAKEAVPALKEALKDEYSNVREAAEGALKKIESTEIP